MAKGMVPRHLLARARGAITGKTGTSATNIGGGSPSKIGATEGMTDRTVATADTPGARAGLGDNKTQVDTYFTSGPVAGAQPAMVYTGDRLWARVSLTLETAGPVSVGTSRKLQPVLGGGGRLLITGQTITFTIAKGTPLFIASTGVNRVGRVIEPVPWLEQIVGMLSVMVDRVVSFASGKRTP